MKKLLLVICYILFLTSIQTRLAAQNDAVNFNGKSSLLFDIWGPEVIGVYFNYYINNRISTNFGLGVSGFHIGTNIYVIKRNKSRHSIYIGGQITHYWTVDLGIGLGGSPPESDNQWGIYFPFGYEYTAKKYFTFQIDLGPNIVSEDWGQSNTFPLMLSIKIGKTFNLLRSKNVEK